jgi:hypothetical protein
MSDKYNTIQQHEPLRVPSGWTAEEKRLIAQLEEIFDDLYRRFNRLRLEDMNSELRKTLVSAAGNTTAIEQAAEAIRLTAQRVEEIEDGTVPVGAVENTAVEVKPAGVSIKTGGTFTVESGNFELDGEGNVSIKNADISRNLSMGGATVLTGKDIVISSSQPTETWPGLLWIRPIGNTSLTYRSNAIAQTSFMDISSYPLTCLGAPVDTTGAFSYRLRFPYRCTTTSMLSDRYVTAILESGSRRVTITSRLKQYATDGLAHGFMFDESFPGDVWLGSDDKVRLTLILTSDASDPYKFYKIDSGTISLTCNAITGGSSGFITADVKVFQ